MKTLEQRTELLNTITVNFDSIRSKVLEVFRDVLKDENIHKTSEEKACVVDAVEVYQKFISATGLLLGLPEDIITDAIAASNAMSGVN